MTVPPETGEAAVTEETLVRCACGRLLADPVSRARGLGPRCYRRLHGHTAARLRETRKTIKVRAGATQLALDDCEPDWIDDDPDWDDHYQPFLHADLLGQRIKRHARITDIPLTGSYL